MLVSLCRILSNCPPDWVQIQQDPQYAQFLVEEANTSRDLDRRIIAVSDLGFLSESALALETCRHLLSDSEPEVREAAVLAVLSLRDFEALSALEEIEVSDPSEAVQAAARKAVSELRSLEVLSSDTESRIPDAGVRMPQT